MIKGIGFILGLGLVVWLLNTHLHGNQHSQARNWFSTLWTPAPQQQRRVQAQPPEPETPRPALQAVPAPPEAAAKDTALPAITIQDPLPQVPAQTGTAATATDPTLVERPRPSVQDDPPADPLGSRDARQWQPVWQAFRSELSARGFAAHLEKHTGASYRVTRHGGWSYQVELGYTSEQGLSEDLAAVNNSLGIRLQEGEP